MGGVLHNIYIVHDCKPYIYKHTALTFFFTSEIEKAVSAGYRSPACLFLKLNNKEVALIVNNENPVKEKLKQGSTVMIADMYQKGLLSSVKIQEYTIN